VPDEDSLFDDFERIGLASWRDTLGPILRERLADGAHGDLPEWRKIIEALPVDLESAADVERARALLLQLAPWRKGPFHMRGIDVDAEWRSDLKWDRLKNEISLLNGRNVLDVGSGNGYYAFRMIDAGAATVIGIDPTILFVCQFLAIRKLTGTTKAHVLPLRLEELPPASRAFDTTFSMGVLYHRRRPLQHLQELFGTLRPGGELVLETLILPGNHCEVLEPPDRYARMRNVWHLPTVVALQGWLEDAGFVDLRLVNVTPTTTEEQRTTEWMPYESLAEALDPDDPALTVEGLPAPVRAIVLATAP
jgi:tRNA (mo5U34)-methyltransferase